MFAIEWVQAGMDRFPDELPSLLGSNACFQQLLVADSKGACFNRYIQNFFCYQRLSGFRCLTKWHWASWPVSLEVHVGC